MTSQQTLNLQESSLEHVRSAAGMAEFPDVPNEYLRAAMFLSKHAGTTCRGKWKVLAEALGLKEDYDASRSNYGKFVQTAIKQLKKEADASSVPTTTTTPVRSTATLIAPTTAPGAASVVPSTPYTNVADLQYLAQTVDKLAMVVADRDAKAADRDAKAADRDEKAADERLELQRDVVQLRREAAQRDEKQDERNAKQDERNAKADKEREVLLEATTTAVKTAVESKKESELALNLATSLRGDVDQVKVDMSEIKAVLFPKTDGGVNAEEKVAPRVNMFPDDDESDSDDESEQHQLLAYAERQQEIAASYFPRNNPNDGVSHKTHSISDDEFHTQDETLEEFDAPKNVSSKKSHLWIIFVVIFIVSTMLLAVQLLSSNNLLLELDSNTMQQLHRMTMDATASVTSFIDEVTSSSDFGKVMSRYLSDMYAVASSVIIDFQESISRYNIFPAYEDGYDVPDYSPSEFV